MKKCLTYCLYCYLLCRRGNKHFDVFFWRIRLVLFSSKDGKYAAYEGKNAWKGVYFPSELASCAFVVNMIKVLIPICTLTWRVNNYVCRQGKGINRRIESTISMMNYCTVLCNYFWELFNLTNCCWLETCFSNKIFSCVIFNWRNKTIQSSQRLRFFTLPRLWQR